MLDLTLLGTGGGMPMPNRFLASLLINYRGNKILLDCGEGTQVSMRICSTGFKSVDLILITHTHGDHINGLLGILSTIGNSDRVDPLTIIGPTGIVDAINAFKILVPYLPYDINVIEIKENEDFIYKFKEMEIHALYVSHSSPCIAYSFYLPRRRKFLREKAEELNIPTKYWKSLHQGNPLNLNGNFINPKMVLGENRGGIKFSYVTDTRPLDSIKDFILNSQLLFCEGTYESLDKLDKALKNFHMTFEEAATLALKGNCEELILTHFSPAILNPEDYINNAQNIFSNSHIGKDHESITLSFNEE